VAPAVLSLFNQVQDVDPAQYADVARRMLQGHWLALREMRGAFVNKPPLMMWAQAAVMALVGVGSFAARLPALLYGLLAVFGTFLVGQELRDRKHGLIAAVLFASSVAFHHMVLDPKVDMPLVGVSGSLRLALQLDG
jgi:4-amino-4-deoxy-L-arabinose transferase-like glycosyltransferase